MNTVAFPAAGVSLAASTASDGGTSSTPPDASAGFESALQDAIDGSSAQLAADAWAWELGTPSLPQNTPLQAGVDSGGPAPLGTLTSPWPPSPTATTADPASPGAAPAESPVPAATALAETVATPELLPRAKPTAPSKPAPALPPAPAVPAPTAPGGRTAPVATPPGPIAELASARDISTAVATLPTVAPIGGNNGQPSRATTSSRAGTHATGAGTADAGTVWAVLALAVPPAAPQPQAVPQQPGPATTASPAIAASPPTALVATAAAPSPGRSSRPAVRATTSSSTADALSGATTTATAALAGPAQPSNPALPLIAEVNAPPIAAPPPAGPPPMPLQQQLTQPVLSLARQDNGDHTVVVRVAPDDLGPVTVHAQVSDTSVHIELFAPNDAGREAVRQILTDLRRDLNAAAGNASVWLSDQNAPGADSGGRQQTRSRSTSRGGASAMPGIDAAEAPAAGGSAERDASPSRRTHALDVIV